MDERLEQGEDYRSIALDLRHIKYTGIPIAVRSIPARASMGVSNSILIMMPREAAIKKIGTNG